MSNRVHLVGRLTTTGPLAIHTGGADERTDQPLRTDQRAAALVPGTSLAGALRAASTRVHGPGRTAELFGPEAGGDASREPSRTVVFDAPLWEPQGRDVPPIPELRHHVGIERSTLTALENVLFDEMVWPSGLSFELRIEAERDDLADLLRALADLCSPRGGIGSGSCPVRLDDLTAGLVPAAAVTAVDDAATRWLDEDHATWPTVDAAEHLAWPPAVQTVTGDPDGDLLRNVDWLAIDLALRLVDPLATRVPVDPSAGLDLDNLPFTVTRWKSGRTHRTAALASSSLRGILRQRAERWSAAVGRPAGSPWGGSGDAPADHPLRRTFGRAPEGRDDAGARAARLRVSDFVDEEGWEESDADQLSSVVTVDRIALDRLSGATYASAKFQDTVVSEGRVLRGTVVLASPSGEPVDPLDVAFVGAGLRDLASGAVGVGGSSHSGYGTVEVVEAVWRWSVGDRSVEVATAPGEVVPAAWVEPIRQAWDTFRKEG